MHLRQKNKVKDLENEVDLLRKQLFDKQCLIKKYEFSNKENKDKDKDKD